MKRTAKTSLLQRGCRNVIVNIIILFKLSLESRQAPERNNIFQTFLLNILSRIINYSGSNVIYWQSVYRVTFAKVSKLFKKPPPLIILRDSPQEGLQQGLSGSAVTGSTFLKNSSNTQSIMRMIRWGGLASFLTVAMCAGLMVCKAASASSNAGFAASSFSSATALSSYWSKNSMFSVSH